MSNLENAVAKTMNFVFAELENPGEDKRKRIASLKANIGKIANIALDEIETNENIRKSIDTESDAFLRLVESIKKYGILENIVAELRINKKENDYTLVCIAGHRRILAAKAAGSITKVPCLLQAYQNPADNIGAALAENLNREDLHCLDVADGYKKLLLHGWQEDELAHHFCRDVRTVRHYLKMADWQENTKALLRSHPDKFSTRVIMRNFAYKKFASMAELNQAIQEIINPKKINNKVKSHQKNVEFIDKKSMQDKLKTYLNQQKLLSSIIKDEIKKAFSSLNLI
jgi:ParB/RepB/Spo0J family partition protein